MESDIYIGAKLNILGRQIEVIDFGDYFTKQTVLSKRERSFMLIQPEVVHRTGEIFNVLRNNGFKVNRCQMVKWSSEDVRMFYKDKLSDPMIS